MIKVVLVFFYGFFFCMAEGWGGYLNLEFNGLCLVRIRWLGAFSLLGREVIFLSLVVMRYGDKDFGRLEVFGFFDLVFSLLISSFDVIDIR